MNKRIKELIKSLGIIPEDEHYEVAQLIVKECINICKDIADPHLHRNQDTHQRMAPGASYAAKLIESRFLELSNE